MQVGTPAGPATRTVLYTTGEKSPDAGGAERIGWVSGSSLKIDQSVGLIDLHSGSIFLETILNAFYSSNN